MQTTWERALNAKLESLHIGRKQAFDRAGKAQLAVLKARRAGEDTTSREAEVARLRSDLHLISTLIHNLEEVFEIAERFQVEEERALAEDEGLALADDEWFDERDEEAFDREWEARSERAFYAAGGSYERGWDY